MENILDILKEIICEYVEVDEDCITPDASLRFDVGASSFDLMNIAVAIEERFNISISNKNLPVIKTVGDIAALLEKKLSETV